MDYYSEISPWLVQFQKLFHRMKVVPESGRNQASKFELQTRNLDISYIQWYNVTCIMKLSSGVRIWLQVTHHFSGHANIFTVTADIWFLITARCFILNDNFKKKNSIKRVTDGPFVTARMYEIYPKMAQNCCDRDRTTWLDMHLNFKWPKYLFPFRFE